MEGQPSPFTLCPMIEELSKKELAEAKRQARRLRISRIRRRVATGSVMLVALFSGLVLYRSLDQQATTAETTTTASVTRSDEESDVQSIIGAAIVDQAVSVFSDDDHDDDEGGNGGSIVDVVTGSNPAPMTSSQS